MHVQITMRYHRTKHRFQDVYADVRAVLAGYCNHCPYDGEPGKGGGYSFWRCALPRGHESLHRSLNYVWSQDGRTDYLPIPIGAPMPNQPFKRTIGHTRSQRRRYRAWARSAGLR